ncbi:BatA domain-containing protein [bacterium]|nr:BatA domain-containing protein [bacterium]
MLSFLNNIFLPILVLASLPVLIHLLSRRRIKRIRFSTLRFMKELQKKQMRRIKLRQILLLIIRTLIILFIVAAFARPAVKGKFSSDIQAHEPTSVAILLDNSYSMGQESRGVDLFTQARAKAHQIIEFLKPRDDCLLIVFNDHPQLVTNQPTRLFNQLSSALDTIEVSDRGTDVYSALGLGLKMLEESKHLHRELYILTDDKDRGWREWSRTESSQRIQIFAIPFTGDYEDNQSVDKITFPNQLLEVGKPINLSVTVNNHTSRPAGGILTSIYLDGKRVAQRDLDLLSNASGQVDAQIEVYQGGNHSGYAEIEGDAILTDNRYYFSFKIPQKIRTLLVGENNRLFVKLALDPHGDGFFEITEKEYRYLGGEILAKYDLIILLDPPSLSSDIFAKLKTFIEKGGGIFLTLGENTDITNLQANLLNEISGIYLSDRTSGGNLDTYMQLENVDYAHPVFQVFNPDNNYEEVTFFRFYPASASKGIIAEFNNGSPFILEADFGEGRMMVMTTSLAPAWSNLGLSGLLVPLFHRCSQYLASKLSRFNEPHTVGEPFLRILEEDIQATSFALRKPDRKKLNILPSYQEGKLAFRIDNPDQAGIYEIWADSMLIDISAVNPQILESDMSPLQRDEVEERIKVKWVDPDEEIENVIFSSRYGKELWKLFLWIVFVLMVAEILLATTWRKPKEFIEEENPAL